MEDVRRAVRINFKDGSSTTLELSKATEIRAAIGMLHLDKLKDGTWRLTYSSDITKDFSKVVSFEMVREDSKRSVA
jgi:hypothetical protein